MFASEHTVQASAEVRQFLYGTAGIGLAMIKRGPRASKGDPISIAPCVTHSFAARQAVAAVQVAQAAQAIADDRLAQRRADSPMR